MINKICCIFNVAPHYNAPIYKLMDSELSCDFYLGDRIHTPLKLMDYNELRGYKGILKYKTIFGKFYWQKGVLKNIFKPYAYYVMNGEAYCVSTWVVLFACMFTKKKVFLWTHGWYGDESFIKKIVKKAFYNLSSKLLLYGDYARNLMIKEGFDDNKLVSIYNSLDYNKQLSIRCKQKNSSIYRTKFDNDLPVLLFIGRIQTNKQIDLLIDAIGLLQRRGVFYNLVIIGEEVEDTEIKSLIDKNNINQNVWLYGACYDEESIGELIYNADVCISPGNVGLTAMHSLMYGTPIITHSDFSKQMPEFEAIKENVTGAFFKRNDVFDLARVIQEWLAGNSDRREFIRKEAYKVIDERYNPYVQIEILKRLFL